MSRVQVALSVIGGVPGVMAYHSSVLVDGVEYSFSGGGVSRATGPASHGSMGRGRPKLVSMGASPRTAAELLAELGAHFVPGSYDLLRKNCNTWTDAALFFLVRRRLGAEYRAVEKLGASMPALIQAVSGGGYAPNPRAARFDLEDLVRNMRRSRPEQQSGGPDLSADERLARELQAEEDAMARRLIRGARAAPTSQPQEPLTDEELARALQAEEDARAGVPRGGGSSRGAGEARGQAADLGQAVQEMGRFVDDSVRHFQRELQRLGGGAARPRPLQPRPVVPGR